MPLTAKNTSKRTKLVQVLGQKPRQKSTDNGPLNDRNPGRDSTHSAFYSRTPVLYSLTLELPLPGVERVCDPLPIL